MRDVAQQRSRRRYVPNGDIGIALGATLDAIQKIPCVGLRAFDTLAVRARLDQLLALSLISLLANAVQRRAREERQIRGVARHAIVVLNNERSPLRDRIEQFATAVMAVNGNANAIADLKVRRDGAPDVVARELSADRSTLHAHDRFSRMKIEGGIERERPRVVGGLKKTDAQMTSNMNSAFTSILQSGVQIALIQ